MAVWLLLDLNTNKVIQFLREVLEKLQCVLREVYVCSILYIDEDNIRIKMILTVIT